MTWLGSGDFLCYFAGKYERRWNGMINVDKWRVLFNHCFTCNVYIIQYIYELAVYFRSCAFLSYCVSFRIFHLINVYIILFWHHFFVSENAKSFSCLKHKWKLYYILNVAEKRRVIPSFGRFRSSYYNAKIIDICCVTLSIRHKQISLHFNCTLEQKWTLACQSYNKNNCGSVSHFKSVDMTVSYQKWWNITYNKRTHNRAQP